MQIMEKHFVTIGPEGEFEVPAEMREALGIVEGTRVGFRLDGPRIVIELETSPEGANPMS
jgi:bifunctional DNA-binding transcriptional regulator/antitoxin component of YhaV-PrlF toxin-antitoxin module